MIYVIAAIILASLNNVFLHFLSAKKIEYNVFAFNALTSFVWIICLFIFNKGWQCSSSYTLIYGFAYGITLTGFIFFKCMAMVSGPISLTAVIGCASFVITSVFNALFWRENIGFFEIAGIVLMLIAVVVINFPQKSSENVKEKINIKWMICCLFFFIFSASVGIIFKMHQNADADNTNEMMIIAATVSTVVFLLLFSVNALIKKSRMHSPEKQGQHTRAIDKNFFLSFGIAICCGLFGCVYNRLNIYNSGVLPSMLFFPIFNGGVIILSFLSSWLFFKEKPRRLQFIGCMIGLIAVVVNSHVFGAL